MEVEKFTNKKIKNYLFNFKNKNLVFNGAHFMSKPEIEIAMCLHYQEILKLKLYSNYQVKILRKFIDFYVEKYNCFIEVHPMEKWKLNSIDYYRERREVLNKGGYKNSSLLLIN